MSDSPEFPKLRPVEVHASSTHVGAYDLTDPSGIAPGRLTLSSATMFVVSRMDGRHRPVDIQAEFMRRHGTLLFSDDLDGLVQQLDKARFLDGPSFKAHITELTRQYRDAPFRSLRDKDSLGVPVSQLGACLDSMLGDGGGRDEHTAGRVVGLIAPHLDYARGAPCYAAAYHGLADRTDATRFVILGANHFGCSTAVVGTRKDFETPFGVVPHDGEFMRRLDDRTRADLCELEYDHVHEHSIELQVVLLKHVMGERPFTVVPFLCPDPCGPTGTAPRDDLGVDLKDFATALRAEIEADDTPTCVVAGADLSHVGAYFHDDHDLGADDLHALEAQDRQVLEHVENSDPELLRAHVARAENATNICSVGSIYVLSTVLKDRARPRLLAYHQAVIREVANCVTCAAMEFTTRQPSRRRAKIT
ncbi:MAG: AmmeMemoRadiSam system protein B [Phycisphaerae bacterium]|nr:AmmeMemoRadiSam system protein B [Phycisphaerae bacterium]